MAEQLIHPKAMEKTLSSSQNEKPKIPLKPCLQNNNPIKTPLLSQLFSNKNLHQWPLKVNFCGWRKPTNDWSDWVEKLSLKYAKIWEQTGICDAILSSLHEVKPNCDIVLGLVEFWCPETNSFIFPWGEATITLEDVMILVGLPVLGENVNIPLLGDSLRVLEEKLNEVRSDLCRNNKAKKASYSAWIKYFNEGNEGLESLEHVGFLAFWLSKFVFPTLNDKTVGKHVFPIAVNLSQGVKTALAPAVLACLYQNLTFLTQSAAEFDSAKREVSAPGYFQIVQLWALERFPLLLGLKLAKPLSLGQPRVARWDKVSLKLSLVDVRSIVLRSADSFQWRPYALDLQNWRHPSFYPENELILSDLSTLEDEELKSFCVFLRPHELVGIDCTDIYRPQRVAMQFGYDQEVPGETDSSSPLELDNLRLVIPSRSYKPGVIKRYKKWWKESVCSCSDANIEVLEKEGIDLKNFPILTSCLVKSERNCDEGHISNAATTSTPASVIPNDLGNNSGRNWKRKYSERRDWKWEGVVIVDLDLDDEDVEKSGHKNADHLINSAKEVRKRVGDSSNNPMYIFDQFSKGHRRGKKLGVSLDNPIDVECYYL